MVESGRGGLPVAGAFDDLAHATEPDAGLVVSTPKGCVGAPGLGVSVEAQVELIAVLFVGTVVEHDVFHNFLISSYRGG